LNKLKLLALDYIWYISDVTCQAERGKELRSSHYMFLFSSIIPELEEFRDRNTQSFTRSIFKT